MKPDLLIELTMKSFSAEDMLSELGRMHLHCVASGRTAVWAKAAHSVIDLLADDSCVQRAKRADLISNDKAQVPNQRRDTA